MKYRAPLVDWISFALNRSCLDQTLESIRKGKKIKHLPAISDSNKRYLEKILREEVVKQFNDYERPMLELVLNSIDAKTKGVTDYTVKVFAKRGQFKVIDDGNSMTLEQILRFLIIPFNTEKDGIEQIGKFGVGFLSNFYYCINNRKTSITVYTVTKDESYSLKFYCPSSSVSDIVLELKHERKSRKPKTIVKIDHLEYNRTKLVTYLAEHLVNIPSYMSQIFLNRTCINKGYDNPWIVVPVTLEIKGKEITQEVGFCRIKDNHIRLTAQGVQVRKFSSNINGVVISFPSVVRVVEGRDEFKIDENYRKCIYAAFEAFEKYALSVKKEDTKVLSLTIELFTELVSAFQVEYIMFIPNIDRIKKILFGDREYMIYDSLYEELSDFLGPECLSKITKVYPASYQLWKGNFKTHKDVFRELLHPLAVIDMEKWRGSLHRVSNLGILFRLLSSYIVHTVNIVRVSPPGKTPFYFKDHILYLNIKHPFCKGDLNIAKLFGLCSEICHETKEDLTSLENYHLHMSDKSMESITYTLFKTAASFYARAINQ